MVSESLTLTFNLLTGYYLRQQPSSPRLGNVIFLGMECVEVKRFLRFSRRRVHGSAQNFFSGFRRKHLFIATHVEKQWGDDKRKSFPILISLFCQQVNYETERNAEIKNNKDTHKVKNKFIFLFSWKLHSLLQG